jgi:hypothetical protein
MMPTAIDYTVHSIVRDRVPFKTMYNGRMVDAEIEGVVMELVADGEPTMTVRKVLATDAEHAAFLAEFHAASEAQPEVPESSPGAGDGKPAVAAVDATAVTVTIAAKR